MNKMNLFHSIIHSLKLFELGVIMCREREIKAGREKVHKVLFRPNVLTRSQGVIIKCTKPVR